MRTARAEWTRPATATTTPASGAPRRDGDRIGEIARPVGVARRRRTHRRRQHDRLGRSDDAGEEIGRLLERVGAVGDDDAAHLRPREMARDRLGEPAPDREVHVLAVDLRHLLALADERESSPPGSAASSCSTGSTAEV